MTYEERVLLIVGVLLLGATLCVAGCKTTSEAESHLAASAALESNSDSHGETHVFEEPGRTTTTVEEFAPPEDAPQVAATPDPSVARIVAPDAVRVNGALLRRTVTVEERGAIHFDATHVATGRELENSTLSSESKTKESFDFLHGPLVWIGFVVVAGGGLGLVLKLRGIL